MQNSRTIFDIYFENQILVILGHLSSHCKLNHCMFCKIISIFKKLRPVGCTSLSLKSVVMLRSINSDTHWHLCKIGLSNLVSNSNKYFIQAYLQIIIIYRVIGPEIQQ